ncbi:2-hydroxychromene-2-carboxylate isomerase [Isoalcanivorax beigongshangi]|uniref:2-hydroxychromene-2-carboxylate isomerase n=1 Tax=Isoalcanivorax beigongshangi TaxID=3238810 RepID=A0ABV4AHA8_9GAMM
MSQTLEFIFDFASPNAYLSHKVLPALAQRTGAELVYTPCLLGGIFKATGNQAPMLAFAGVPSKLQYGLLEMRRFVARHQLPFQMNPHFPLNTLLLMRGAVAAQELGCFEDYVDTMFHFMWEAPRKMDDPQVWQQSLAERGLPAEQLAAAVQTDSVKQTLVTNTSSAVERGAFGIPTFFVGNEMWFGKEYLNDVEAYLTQGARQ